MVRPRTSCSDIDMASAKTVESTAASVTASTMVVWPIVRDPLPSELKHYFLGSIKNFFRSYSSEITVVIEEHEGLACNHIYKATELYLGAKNAPATSYRVSLPVKETKISIAIGPNQEIVNVLQGVPLKWRQVTWEVNLRCSRKDKHSGASELGYFLVKFHRKHKDMVFQSYFPFLLKEGDNVQASKKTLKLYTLTNKTHLGYMYPEKIWHSINLHHPAMFDTLAMDLDLKKTIMDDLDRFLARKDYYQNVGRAWKRGYLLYGPPGTGKSSLAADMVNYINFDIYDLELTSIHHNSELQSLLLATGNYSILVMVDIDCSSLQLKERQEADAQTSHPKSPVKRS